MQASIGLAQLDKLKNFIKIRKSNFLYLLNLLKLLINIFHLQGLKKADPSWFGFPILIRNNKISRNELINYLEKNGIKTRLIFAGNLIKQPYMKEQNYIVKGKLKNSDKVMRNAFWVGIYPELSKIQLKKIAKTIYQFINQKKK